MKNPWLNIPAEDYEGHMSAPHVAQLQFLNNLLGQLLSRYQPESLLVAGCTTGNGFEHIDFKITHSAVGIDINKKYLQIAHERFTDRRIEFINDDVCTHDFGNKKFDLIHCALIFEYVDVEICAKNLVKYLNVDGVLSVVLQLPSEHQTMVSKTNFKSLETLASIMKSVDKYEFAKIFSDCNLSIIEERVITLKSGKSFFVGILSDQKSSNGS